MLMKNLTKNTENTENTENTDDVKMHRQENPKTKLFKTYLVKNNHLTQD